MSMYLTKWASSSYRARADKKLTSDYRKASRCPRGAPSSSQDGAKQTERARRVMKRAAGGEEHAKWVVWHEAARRALCTQKKDGDHDQVG